MTDRRAYRHYIAGWARATPGSVVTHINESGDVVFSDGTVCDRKNFHPYTAIPRPTTTKEKR